MGDTGDGRIRISYWEKWIGPEQAATRAVVEAFNRSQDRIVVEYLVQSPVDRKMIVAVAGGDPPDVAGLWVQNVASFADAEALTPLDDFIRRDGMTPEQWLGREAARIDGSSEWRIFWRIVLQLSKPVLAVAALFHFLYAWNDFMGPFLYLTRKETFTLSLALQGYQSQVGGVQWHYLMAASIVTMLPIVGLFFFAQRTFIQGIATTGSKG